MDSFDKQTSLYHIWSLIKSCKHSRKKDVNALPSCRLRTLAIFIKGYIIDYINNICPQLCFYDRTKSLEEIKSEDTLRDILNE